MACVEVFEKTTAVVECFVMHMSRISHSAKRYAHCATLVCLKLLIGGVPTSPIDAAPGDQ